MSLNPSTLRKFTHFPKSGSVLGAFDVKEATINLENNTWFVMFDGDVKRKQAREAMKHFVGKPKHIPLNQKGSSLVCVELVCSEVTSVRSNPNGRVTIAKGHLMFPTVRHNPTAAIDFKHEMRDMITDNPEKSFKKYSYSRLNDKDFLDQLWSFVSWSGESYGWVTRDRKIYHRRASLIMPKIKISKRPDNEVAFYHTHPSKDEPSLTSADDIQFYLDLSFEPGIKHHYTVMRDRIDYFKFKVRNNRLQKYLDMDEARFVADVDAMIDVAEKEVKKDNLDPVDHCFEVTKKVVQKFNQKFKGIASITYKQFVKPDYLPEDVVNPFGEALANPGPINNPSLFREVSPEEFVSARKYAKRRAFLSPHSAKHIRETNTKAYLSTDNLTGYLIDPTGDLQNLFNIGKAGQGALAVRDAISRGVISVDAFGPFLPKYYAQFGFEEWGRYKWDDNYAPRDWDYSTYGRPDVVFMKLPGVKINPSIGNYPRPNPGPVIPEKYDHRVLNDLKGLDYDWVHYGGDEFAHTTYVHWWMKHYFGPATRTRPQSLYKLEPIGFDKELRGKTRDYLSTVFANNWTYLDMLYLVGIYHDSGKKVQKDGGPHHSMAAKNMWDDFIADELDVPHAMEEAVSLMFESDIGRRGISEGFFQTLTGDYYGIAVIMQLADIATHHPYMYTSIAEQYRKAGDFSGNVEQFKDWWMRQHVEKLRTFLNKPRKNPKPVPLMVRWRGSYETPISPRLAEALLEAYSQENVEDEDGKKGKKFMATVGSGYLRFNTDNLGLLTGKIPENSVVKAQLGFSTGNLTISFSRKNAPKDAGREVAQIIYEHVGEILRGAIPDVVIDTEVEGNVQTNPRKMEANVIIISGPSGVGKSTFVRYLKKNLEGAGEPLTVTSRPRRPKERKGIDRHFVTKERFLDMIEDGEFVEWTQQRNGHYYGRRFADFNYKYNIVDVNLRGMRKYKEAFPNAHAIFLKPDVSPKSLLRRILRRGGMTYEEAKSRVRKAKPMIEQAKTMDFDQTSVIHEGRFEEDFAQLLRGIPIANPGQISNFLGTLEQAHSFWAKVLESGQIIRTLRKDADKENTSVVVFWDPVEIDAQTGVEKGRIRWSYMTGDSTDMDILYIQPPQSPLRLDDRGWQSGINANPSRTPEGRKIPKKYLKGLNREEMAIAAKEIDKGYKYDADDPEAYEEWKSDIKAKARGYKTVPSKYKKKFIEMYGPLPEKGKFIDKVAKATKIKKSILQKVYDKGLAAWATGHRVGVAPHQWATGRVYSFVTLGNTVKKGNKKMSDYSLAVEAGLVKDNPPKMSCPPATQDLELNTKNRDAAVKAEHIQYGPLNLSDKDYWVRYAERWNTTPAVAKKSNCSNCIAFDISPRMKDCMPGKTSDKDGELGYCWMHHFKCHSARSCYTWAKGGPISKDKVSHEWQERAFPSENPPDPFFPGDAVKKYPWLRHADLIQQNSPGTLPPRLVVIGERDGKKVVVFAGRPYYQSTGTSPASGTGATKRKGEWYGFAGIEPDKGKWFPNEAGEWWIKGSGPGIPPFTSVVLDPNTGFYEPKREGRYIKTHEHNFGHFPQIRSAREMNELLAQHGFIAPIRGKYPSEVPVSAPAPGSLRAQAMQFRSNPSGEWPVGLRYLSADSSVEEQYPGIHNHPLGPITLWHGSPFSQSIESIKRQGLVPANQSGQYTSAGGGGGSAHVSLTPHRWEAAGYAKEYMGESRKIPGVSLMIGVRGRDLNHPDYKTMLGGGVWDSGLRVPSVLPQYLEVFGFFTDSEKYPMPPQMVGMLNEANAGPLEGEDLVNTLERIGELGYIPASELKGAAFNPKEGPDLFSYFERWAKLVNMKNKELKAFLDSPLGKTAGLSPQEAKEQGIFSGRVSGRRILKMREKIGLGGPKDYIKGPRHLEEKWEVALNKWTGPSKDYMNGTTDWDWCMRQVRFNTRHGAFPYNHNAEDRKGPLIKKQKTQNKVSRRLLGLWVWGHDPWRWARKHGVERMPKCPDVPWVGMTEKRKYGKVPVVMNPKVKTNPHIPDEFEEYPYESMKREFDDWVADNTSIEYPLFFGSEGKQEQTLKYASAIIQLPEFKKKYPNRKYIKFVLAGDSPFAETLYIIPKKQFTRKVKKWGKKYGAELVKANPHGGAHRVPQKYKGQPMDEHSDLYVNEKEENTIEGLGFKDRATAIKSVNIIKRSGKTHAHKIQAAMAMEQRARFHPNATPGIKAAQKVYAKFIEEMKKKTKSRKNPSQTYYHGSPVKDIKTLRVGSYVSPDYQTAYDMGRYHLATGKTWTDDDLEYPMEWGTRPVFKQGREPKGKPTVYSVEIHDDDLIELGSDEDGKNWEYQIGIEAKTTRVKPRKNPSDERNPFEEYRKAQDYRNELDYLPLMEDITDEQRAEWFRRDKIMKSLEQEIVDTYGREIFNDAFGGYYVPPHRALYRIENEDLARYRIVGDRGEGTVLLENVDTKERRDYVPLSALRELHPDFKANPAPPQPNLNNLDSVRKHVEWIVRPGGEFSGDGIYIFDTRGIFQSSMYQRSPDYHRIIVRDGEPQLNTEWDRKVFAEGEEIEYYPKVVLTKFSNEFKESLVNPSRHDWVDEEDDEILQMFEW